MKYKYIYFNPTYSDPCRYNPDDYNVICLKDLEKYDNIQIVPIIMDQYPLFLRKLYYFHYTLKRKLHFPFLSMWFHLFFKNKFKGCKKEELCFVIGGSTYPGEFAKWLRKKYKESKLVRIHRDLLKVTCNNGYNEKMLKETFDLQLTFDTAEAEKHGFEHFDEYESRIDIDENELNKYPKVELFFAGLAKDRYEKLLKIARILREKHISFYFYIVGVPKEKREEIEGIVYDEKLMSYTEMLYRTIRANCSLDINQDGGTGFTSRFIEAVLYNKKLITDNVFVKDSKFYNDKFIQCVSSFDEIDTKFITSEDPVNYNYKGEFSPINLINIMEKKL